MITANGHVITPTIFPDKTSQVWKIPECVLESGTVYVQWYFEHEGELMHLLQLRRLLDTKGTSCKQYYLNLPFLPYGRQDKGTNNDSCFALSVFLDTLGDWDKVTTIDAHSWTMGVISIYPGVAIANAIKATGATAVCFPDKGASNRYKIDLRTIVLEKVREPSTGEIIGITVLKDDAPIATETSILIVDDICDGGRTFIESAKVLREHNPQATISLYVSHGIFSKGVQVLRDAGISRIFTKDGEVS